MINSFFGFHILQLGMMGTSVFYASGDTGVAGPSDTEDSETICQNSKRMSWAPLKCYLVFFDIYV